MKYIITYTINPGFDQKFEDDFRELFTQRLKEDEDFGSELWSAMANVDWIHEDDPEETRIHRGFRSAGSMIATMLGTGDYIDWYCSGPYETVSEYIAQKMASKGWRYEIDGKGSDINKGRLSYTNGSIYEGEIENGIAPNGARPNGKGKLVYKGLDVYEGDFVNGELHGKGKYTWTDSDYEPDSPREYEGDFAHGKQHGKGKRAWSDGFVKEGNWKNGELESKPIPQKCKLCRTGT